MLTALAILAVGGLLYLAVDLSNAAGRRRTARARRGLSESTIVENLRPHQPSGRAIVRERRP